MFDFSQFNNQYQQWVNQTQQAQSMWANNLFAQSPFHSGWNNNPLSQWQTALGLFQQHMGSNPWMQGAAPFGQPQSSYNNFAPFFASSMAQGAPLVANYVQALGDKFQRLHQLLLQLMRLAVEDNDAQSQQTRHKINLISKEIATMLVEHTNTLIGNLGTMQFINSTRSGLEAQRSFLEDVKAQSALTPYYSEIESYIQSCDLWCDMLDNSLAMLDVVQQFSSLFCEKFADILLEKVEKDPPSLQSTQDVLDLFVYAYETEFTTFLRSPNFSGTYGAFVNSVLALRADLQKYIDKTVESFGLPSKREMDTTHQRLHQTIKDVRAIKFQVEKHDHAAADQQLKLLEQVKQWQKESAKLQQLCLTLEATVQKQNGHIETLQTRLGSQNTMLELATKTATEAIQLAQTNQQDSSQQGQQIERIRQSLLQVAANTQPQPSTAAPAATAPAKPSPSGAKAPSASATKATQPSTAAPAATAPAKPSPSGAKAPSASATKATQPSTAAPAATAPAKPSPSGAKAPAASATKATQPTTAAPAATAPAKPSPSGAKAPSASATKATQP